MIHGFQVGLIGHIHIDAETIVFPFHTKAPVDQLIARNIIRGRYLENFRSIAKFFHIGIYVLQVGGLIDQDHLIFIEAQGIIHHQIHLFLYHQGSSNQKDGD